MRKVFLVGCSGSIGENTIACINNINIIYEIANQREKCIKIVGLSVKENEKELERLTELLKPESISIEKESSYKSLKKQLFNVKVFNDMLEAIKATDFDILVNAVTGSAGLMPTILGIEKKADILLANKESLVMAGSLIKQMLKEYEVNLLPIDSEHSAIFQMLKNYKKEEIDKIILTASGGPFLKKELINPSVEEALKHPNWKMGKKISIDSATMMNKGLEVIEAHFLFDLPYSRIETVIHPQSVIHSFIQTINGDLYAQIGSSDMRFPIQNALTHPDILSNSIKKFNLLNNSSLTFEAPNLHKFKSLKLAYECGKKGGTYLTVMNAANEEAVYLFLEKKILFERIYQITAQAIECHNGKTNDYSIDDILAIDKETKAKIRTKFI